MARPLNVICPICKCTLIYKRRSAEVRLEPPVKQNKPMAVF